MKFHYISIGKKRFDSKGFNFRCCVLFTIDKLRLWARCLSENSAGSLIVVLVVYWASLVSREYKEGPMCLLFGSRRAYIVEKRKCSKWFAAFRPLCSLPSCGFCAEGNFHFRVLSYWIIYFQHPGDLKVSSSFREERALFRWIAGRRYILWSKIAHSQ